MIADFAQPRLLAAAADQQLCLPHGDVLEERQRAARGEQPHQRRQQLLDERGRKIVQRQARDDRVVAGLDGQVLDGLVQDADARGDRQPPRVGFEAGPQMLDELVVHFNQVEGIVRTER